LNRWFEFPIIRLFKPNEREIQRRLNYSWTGNYLIAENIK
jgi:hypothetical protein